MEFSSGVIFRRDYSIQNLTRNWREEGNIGINYDVHDRVTGLMKTLFKALISLDVVGYDAPVRLKRQKFLRELAFRREGRPKLSLSLSLLCERPRIDLKIFDPR